MTSGGLVQLVAYGAQDVYLTANPQVTMFKQTYRRHTNFAIEAIEQTFNGMANFGKRVTCTIARNGDLMSRIYLQATLPSLSAEELGSAIFAWIPFVGQYLIKSVELEIGGQLIDKHYGEWLHIWNELTLNGGKGRDYLHMVNSYGGVQAADASGGSTNMEQFNAAIAGLNGSGTDGSLGTGIALKGVSFVTSLPETTLYIPLEFGFNRNIALALPLIALQYHDVKLNIEFNELKYLVNAVGLPSERVSQPINVIAQKGLVSASLFVDYIFLDTEERRRFAQVAHEYLIEQLQFTGEQSINAPSVRIPLMLNHPVKELVWVVQNPAFVDCMSVTNCPWRYSDATGDTPVLTAKLQLNGHDRFAERQGKYFNRVQPFQHHSNSPSMGIHVYSFALKPEDLQSSGTCNFSRINSAILQMTLTPAAFQTSIEGLGSGQVFSPPVSSLNVRVYAVNYNVLRIMSGMGGLAYSN